MKDIPIMIDNAKGEWYFDARWFNFLKYDLVFRFTQNDKIIGDEQ